ncbi:MAG: hypothetical protein BWK76_10100 [Desulfobulbaceae bacterium A2]|nr:MAG: hypothetical protein BWK76_10100 [Desulfobulbaceae bacterium A2]
MDHEKKKHVCRRVVLTGYRACGKTTVGRLLAARLGWPFLDSDEEIQRRCGRTVAELVAAEGWPAFRALERQLLEELAEGPPLVLATGGGAIMHREAWTRLRQQALVVWLQADIAVIHQRLAEVAAKGQRPSLTAAGLRDEVGDVLAAREPLYREGSDCTIDTGILGADVAAAHIADLVTAKKTQPLGEDHGRK